MSEQPTYYAIVPANVRYDNTLKANEKLLYGEITCLSNKTGKCTVMNKYFADLYEVSKETISRWVSSLADRGYIQVQIIRDNITNQVCARYISVTQEVLTKKSIPSPQKNQYTIDEKVKDNNTSINNTSINNTSINNTSINNTSINNNLSSTQTDSLVESVKSPTKEKESVPRLDSIKEVVSFLNEKSGKAFRYQTSSTQSHIGARLKEGFTVEELKRVIVLKCKEWGGDKDMEQYIRPQTLFAGKFESYLQSAPKINNKPEVTCW